jgi:hypothetical protein
MGQDRIVHGRDRSLDRHGIRGRLLSDLRKRREAGDDVDTTPVQLRAHFLKRFVSSGHAVEIEPASNFGGKCNDSEHLRHCTVA